MTDVTKMEWAERKRWIYIVWNARRKHIKEPRKFVPVNFWRAVSCTLALILNNEYTPDSIQYIFDCSYPPEKTECGWRNLGTYETDYGTGYAFECICCFWYRGRVGFYIYEDGSL